MGGKPSTGTPADMRLKENRMDISTAARDKAAKDGDALSDGSYPIRNRADLARAIKAYGRATNPIVVKRHIIKRAKALNATDLLPDNWT
jgi:hypothetical protein